MWIPWAWALAAFLLAAGGAAVTALRSSLLIVGEEGLAEDASAGKGIAGELLLTVRDPEVRHPFSLWVAASAFKAVAGLCAGGGAAVAARLLDRLGRLLFGKGYVPEALSDIRFGSEEGILDVIEEGAEHGTIDPTAEGRMEGGLGFGGGAGNG